MEKSSQNSLFQNVNVFISRSEFFKTAQPQVLTYVPSSKVILTAIHKWQVSGLLRSSLIKLIKLTRIRSWGFI